MVTGTIHQVPSSPVLYETDRTWGSADMMIFLGLMRCSSTITLHQPSSSLKEDRLILRCLQDQNYMDHSAALECCRAGGWTLGNQTKPWDTEMQWFLVAGPNLDQDSLRLGLYGLGTAGFWKHLNTSVVPATLLGAVWPLGPSEPGHSEETTAALPLCFRRWGASIVSQLTDDLWMCLVSNMSYIPPVFVCELLLLVILDVLTL